MTDSPRVRAAKVADRAEYHAVVRSIVRTPEDIAEWLIADFEANTGMTATEGDWAEARAQARELAGGR